jgi:hypothetical protein
MTNAAKIGHTCQNGVRNRANCVKLISTEMYEKNSFFWCKLLLNNKRIFLLIQDEQKALIREQQIKREALTRQTRRRTRTRKSTRTTI